MDTELLRQASEQFPTPLYLYDEDTFAHRFHVTAELLTDPIELTYSMKANPFVVKQASEMAEHIEVCSYGEFRICKALHIPAEKLLISGVLKKEDEFMEIAVYGRDKAVYTAESPMQFALIEEAGRKYGITLPVLLRLTSGNQFGMDETDITDLVSGRGRYPHTQIIGLHFFSGTKKKNLKKTARELQKLDLFTQELYDKTGFSVQMIEYGTGFSAPYFEKETQTVTPDLMRDFLGLVRAMHYKGKLSVEMGRALAYDCGFYLTKVLDRKKSGSAVYCIVDGGIHQVNYDGQMRGMFVPLTELLKNSSEETQKEDGTTCMICGSLCTVNDVLIADYKKSIPSVGDVLIFKNVGAYSVNEGMSTFLSHELPQIVLYNEKDGFRTARKQLSGWDLNLSRC